MGALDDLIAAQPKRVDLDDCWHQKIAEAKAVGLSWPTITLAIAEDTGTAPLAPETLRDMHARWLRQQGH